MTGTVTERSGKLIVALEGSVDLERAPEIRATLLECASREMDIIVDLSAVQYIDSSGIANLVEALQTAQQSGTRFGLVAVAGQVLRVLQLARLDKVFRIHPALDDAFAQAV